MKVYVNSYSKCCATNCDEMVAGMVDFLTRYRTNSKIIGKPLVRRVGGFRPYHDQILVEIPVCRKGKIGIARWHFVATEINQNIAVDYIDTVNKRV